jgi:hypothetical protein
MTALPRKALVGAAVVLPEQGVNKALTACYVAWLEWCARKFLISVSCLKMGWLHHRAASADSWGCSLSTVGEATATTPSAEACWEGARQSTATASQDTEDASRTRFPTPLQFNLKAGWKPLETSCMFPTPVDSHDSLQRSKCEFRKTCEALRRSDLSVPVKRWLTH